MRLNPSVPPASSGALRAGGFGWVMWDWHVAMSHAIPSVVFHGLKSARWNSAVSMLVWGLAELELHATVGWIGLGAGG